MSKLKEFYNDEGNYWTVKQPVDQALHTLIGVAVLLPIVLVVDVPWYAGFATGLLSDVRTEWGQYPWHAWYDGPLDLFFYGLGGALCALLIS